MNVSTYTRILAILLIVLQVNSKCINNSKELDDQCSTYCYQVVKPLLQYVNTVKEYNELQHTIKLQAETINKLNELIKSKDIQLAQQTKLSETYESQNQYQKKLLEQYEIQLTTLKSEISLKDKEIKNLQSQNVKTKELQTQITAIKQASSCLGKLYLHAIRVPIFHRMTVPCESNLPEAGAGWTVIQRRKDGSVNFNRTWSEYREGFGNLHGEFFLGLEKIHLLTQSQPHELFVFLGDFFNETRYARYNNFVIGNEKEFYELKELGTFSGTASDSMQTHINQKFSTPDRDSSNNCAKYYSSGWWFSNCYRCNLNGKYINFDNGTDVNGIEWRWWKARPMKFAQMMIRPLE